MSFNYEQYQRDLTAALRTNDKEEILSFLTNYGVPSPSDDLSFWGAVHKMRLSLPTFTEEEKESSREWLRNNGMLMAPPIPANLQKHMSVFSAKFAEAQANGLTEKEATREAAEEATRLHPLTKEDKEALRSAGQAWGAITSSDEIN